MTSPIHGYCSMPNYSLRYLISTCRVSDYAMIVGIIKLIDCLPTCYFVIRTYSSFFVSAVIIFGTYIFFICFIYSSVILDYEEDTTIAIKCSFIIFFIYLIVYFVTLVGIFCLWSRLGTICEFIFQYILYFIFFIFHYLTTSFPTNLILTYLST